jgi:hypothetical protein
MTLDEVEHVLENGSPHENAYRHNPCVCEDCKAKRWLDQLASGPTPL